MRKLKLLFIPYFLLGMFTAVLCSKDSAVRQGLVGTVILGVVHLLFFGMAIPMANRTRAMVSPSAVALGWVLAYIAGLVLTLCAMK